jgi:delta8-fatty-acid desaturase
MEEVAKHCTADDLWVAIEGRVYDLTKWHRRHPGGHLPLINMAGKDATDSFINYHPAEVWQKHLPMFHIAEVSEVATDPIITGFREMRQELLNRGLYRTRPTYHTGKGVIQLILFSASLYCTLYQESLVSHMLGAVLMAIFWQQLAFIGHDTGHNGITHIQWVDNMIGILVGNFFGGVSIGWWKRSHNVHHIVTNSVEHDPDIQHLPVMAVSRELLKKFYSTYHSKWFSLDPFGRFCVKYQHLLYYPIMGLARFNLYAQSWILLLSKETVHYKYLEILASIGFAGWFGALLCALPSRGEAIAFLLISHVLSGILHVQVSN